MQTKYPKMYIQFVHNHLSHCGTVIKSHNFTTPYTHKKFIFKHSIIVIQYIL